VQTSSACRDLLLIQQLNKQQILGMRSLSALLPSIVVIKKIAVSEMTSLQVDQSANWFVGILSSKLCSVYLANLLSIP